MPRIETEIDVKCRPEEAFDYLTDLRNATEWSTEVVDVSYDGKLARGTTGKDVRTMGRKQIVMPWTVTDFERPRRLVLEYGPPFPATADFSFAATKTGTVVNCDTDLRLRGWRRLLGPIITKEDRKADEIQIRQGQRDPRGPLCEARRGRVERGMNEGKAVVDRFYDLINEGATDRLDEVCAPDLIGHAGAGADLAQLKQSIGGFREAFPDLRADLRHAVADGDLVSTWVTYQGTHQGEFAGVSGTGRPIKFVAWDLIRVENGRIAEITQYCDVFTLMNQIGALPTAAPA